MINEVIIEKRKIRIVYILWTLVMVTLCMTYFMQKDTSKILCLMIAAALFITMITVNVRGIKCTDRNSVIWIRNFTFADGPGFCKNCGAKFIYE